MGGVKTNTSKVIQVMQMIEELEKQKVIRFELGKAHAYIHREIQWDGKEEAWKRAFAKNLKAYIDYRLTLIHGDKTKYSPTIRLYDIDSSEFLGELKG
jgi:hypothetical protein